MTTTDSDRSTAPGQAVRGRPKNIDVRVREHLTPGEVEAVAAAAKKRGRYGQRDALAIRMAARDGLRVSELCELRWDQVDLRAGLIHVSRKKNGVPPTHPLNGDEVRALRQLRRDWPDGRQVFVTERGAPFTRSGFAEEPIPSVATGVDNLTRGLENAVREAIDSEMQP